MVVCLSLGRRDIADGFQQPLMIEPSHPFKGSQFHGQLGFPRGFAVNQFSFVQAIDRLGQRVVIAVTTAADRGFYPGLGEALGVADADILRASV